MKKIYLVIGVMLLIFSLIIGSTLVLADTPSETVKQYYELAKKGKVNDAFLFWIENYCEESACPKSTTISGENEHYRCTKQIYEMVSEYQVESEEIEGDTAKVLVTEKINGWNTKTIYKMVRVNKKWMLKTFSSPAMQ